MANTDTNDANGNSGNGNGASTDEQAATGRSSRRRRSRTAPPPGLLGGGDEAPYSEDAPPSQAADQQEDATNLAPEEPEDETPEGDKPKDGKPAVSGPGRSGQDKSAQARSKGADTEKGGQPDARQREAQAKAVTEAQTEAQAGTSSAAGAARSSKSGPRPPVPADSAESAEEIYDPTDDQIAAFPTPPVFEGESLRLVLTAPPEYAQTPHNTNRPESRGEETEGEEGGYPSDSFPRYSYMMPRTTVDSVTEIQTLLRRYYGLSARKSSQPRILASALETYLTALERDIAEHGRVSNRQSGRRAR